MTQTQLNAAISEYHKTLQSLSERVASAAVQNAALREQNALLANRNAELEAQLKRDEAWEEELRKAETGAP